MMHDTIELRTSRSFSNKSSPPRPLDLKTAQSPVMTNCPTPPPTGWQDPSQAGSFNDRFTQRPLRSALFEVPPTPVTPQIAQVSKRIAPTETVRSAPRMNSAQTCLEPGFEPQDPGESGSPTGKRARSATTEIDEMMECTRPRKQQVRERDLIYNPIAALELYDVPVTYVAEKISKIADKFLNRMEGASCLLKFVPQTRPGLNRVKITPRMRPTNPFHLQFHVASMAASSPRSTAVSCEATGCENFMPFHTEVALLRAPLLASLLLSGHVFFGDTLEFELPCPEVFPDVMKWLYTGKCAFSSRTRVEQCLKVLCGR